MFPRHSRTQPFEIRTRSFAFTRSISSFHRVIWTSSPSSSFALQSHTLPTLPERLVNSRTSPFDVTVRSITSTLLSARSSFTFIRRSIPEIEINVPSPVTLVAGALTFYIPRLRWAGRDAPMQNLENIFQRIDNEFRDLKQAENSNVDEIRKILNRQAEALSYLVTRVKELEQRLEVEETWDTSVEEVIKLMALDDAKVWKFRKHKDVYEEIARRGVGEAADTL